MLGAVIPSRSLFVVLKHEVRKRFHTDFFSIQKNAEVQRLNRPTLLFQPAEGVALLGTGLN